MKKRMAIPLLLVCALALTACGDGASEAELTETEEKLAETEASEDAAAVEEETIAEDPVDDESSLKHSSTTFTVATLEETELYNEDGITVTATGFDAEASYGPEIALRVTNNSDRTVDISAEDVSVNGYMMDPGLLYAVASPGDTVDTEITLYNFMLDASGIDTVAEVALTIVIMDDELYEEVGRGERITLTTSAAEGYDQAVDDSGEVLYDEDGIRVLSQGLKEDDTWDGDLVIYAENDTDLYIGVASEDVSVNGEPQEYTSFWADLKPGTRAVTGMYLTNLDEIGVTDIDDVKEISFKLQIIDQDKWEEMDVTDEITLRFD